MDGVPPRVLNPEPLPPPRRRALGSDTFWSLMDKWKVPPDRALTLIGYSGERRDPQPEKPSFQLTDEQAKFLSSLLEIDLTLAVAGLKGSRAHRTRAGSQATGTDPVDALGQCDTRRAGILLWFLNQAVNRIKPHELRIPDALA
jgi:hypothetical protein